MKRRKFKVIRIIIVVCIVIIAASAISKFNIRFPSNDKPNMWSSKTSIADSSNLTNSVSITGKKVSVGENIKSVSEACDFTYKVSHVLSSKKRRTIKLPYLNLWGEIKKDEADNLIGDDTYVVISITIQNNKATSQELYLNSLRLDFKDKFNQILDSKEVHAINHNVENAHKKNAMQYIFKPHESTKFDILFIVKDKLLHSSTIELAITNESPTKNDGSYSDDARFVTIRPEDIKKE